MDTKEIQKDIIKDLGLDGLPEEKQIELLTSMTESILKRITVTVLEKLSEEDKKEFNKIRETENPDKIDVFLKKKIENYEEMIQKIVDEFKKEMKTSMESLS